MFASNHRALIGRRYRVGFASATAVLGLVVASGGAFGTASGAAAASPRRVGPAPAAVNGAKLGALSSTSQLQVNVEILPRSPAALASFASAVSTPGNSLFRHYITPSQFTSRFGPTASAVSAVEKQLAADGLTVGKITANHLTLPVSGTAGTFEKAFSTGFERYRLASGRIAYANTEAPLFPATTAPYVQGVIGLDNLNVAQPLGVEKSPLHREALAPHVVTGGPQPCAAATSAATTYSAYTADEIASAYDISPLYAASDEGSGITVALFELEPNFATDPTAYEACYSGVSSTVTYTKEDGGATGSAGGSGDNGLETELDIENVIGLAPKANVDVFQAPNTDTGLIDNYTGIVDDSAVKVVSTSWGECESESGSTIISEEGTLFEQGTSEGQSIYAAAGDDGSDDCGTSKSLAVDDPASQPYVTGAGGTSMTSITGPTEVVWNDGGSDGAGGGGISISHTMPSYQSTAASSLNVINSNSSGTPCGAASGSYCREVPDVSASADEDHGYVVYYDGAWTSVGGTSGAAPTWAAFTALADASSYCDGTPIGFSNPVLYAAATSNYSGNFNDITSGNNDYNGTKLYPAATGYDMASGLGTPKGAPLSQAVCGGGATTTGLLRVTTSPAVPSQITVDGNISDTWGLTWVSEAPGSHTVCFRAVQGYTTPACQTVTVTAGATTTVTGTFVQRGFLQVETSPAVNSEITYTPSGGSATPMDNYGAWTDVPVGSYSVCFGAVAGYTAPACQTASVTAGATTTITGDFTVNSGATGPTGVGLLRVTTSPSLPSQITVDGNIADTWGLNWLQLAPGSHTVCFSAVQEYTTPACQTVTVTSGATTTVTGTFTERGFLQVETSPAVAGTISINGFPADNWGVYTDEPVGSYTVCFGAVSGDTTPACQTPSVTAGSTTTITGTY